MKNKKYLEQMKKNLEEHTNFYQFKYAIGVKDCENTYFDGSSSCLSFGAGMPVFTPYTSLPEFIDDIAYEKNGRLFHLVTNHEVKRIELGDNIIDNSIMYAAHSSLKLASQEYLEDYVKIMIYQHNIGSFKLLEKENKRKSKVLFKN